MAQSVGLTLGPGGRVAQLHLGSGSAWTFDYAAGSGLPTNITSTTGEAVQIGYQGSLPTSVRWSGSITGSLSLTLNADFLPVVEKVNGVSLWFSHTTAIRC